MDILDLLANKELGAKQKTEALADALLTKKLTVNELVKLTQPLKDPLKATCVEAFEYATRLNTELATPALWQLATESLAAKAPRVKWESAKVIAHTAFLFPKQLEPAIAGLLTNTEHSGTVVRWSAALALGEIIKLKTAHNKELLSAIENIMHREEKNSIKKIYQQALKSIQSKK